MNNFEFTIILKCTVCERGVFANEGPGTFIVDLDTGLERCLDHPPVSAIVQDIKPNGGANG
jgi:hypothetical protein